MDSFLHNPSSISKIGIRNKQNYSKKSDIVLILKDNIHFIDILSKSCTWMIDVIVKIIETISRVFMEFYLWDQKNQNIFCIPKVPIRNSFQFRKYRFFCFFTVLCFADASVQDNGICGMIAATDIGSIVSYEEWSCSSDGITSTDPCIAAWSGITCTDGFVDGIRLISLGMTGNFKRLKD